MIFGFNTDVKHGDTVYHVQSEARVADLLLQTQVFVKGRCVGKRATSYADRLLSPGFSEDQMHELLKAQHRLVLDAVKDGHVESIVSADNEIHDVDGGTLAVRWLNPDESAGATVTMRFIVTDSGSAVAGASVVSKVAVATDAPVRAAGVTDAQGNAVIHVSAEEVTEGVLVQARLGDKSATRKFRLKR